VIELRRPEGIERIEVEAADSYQLEAENMCAAARGEEPALLGREDAVGQASAIEALYESAASGRAVSVAGT
jgi:D-xylose 1-dehydrogenase (NADP+, D-xylono-1,5-lactone-forming)